VRAVFPATKAVSVRVSAVDWINGGLDLEETIAFAKALEEHGCDAIHVASGGLDHRQHIPVGPSYQVPLARAVKEIVKIPVVAVGLITSAEQAEAIISTGDADLIGVARTILYDPRWPWHAAAELGAKVLGPKQYLRSQPHRFRELFGVTGSLSPEPTWAEGDLCHVSLEEE
jgi:2,4-dienoyl-CoA reductase-like NADH-dependent reductase (Old Yellow Enzyme family)